jgi:thioredoxin-related protein
MAFLEIVGVPSKRKRLEDLFRPPVDLIFGGSFQAARDAGTRENRWILVNIQNNQEFACQILNRDVWADEKVREIVNENFLFWQVSTSLVITVDVINILLVLTMDCGH